MKDKYLDILDQISFNKNKTTQPLEAHMNLEQTLKDRNATHGDFREGAKVSQHLKKVVGKYEDKLTATQRESLEMIMHKIARILNGDPMHSDTWQDIAGYATLAIEDIKASQMDDLNMDNAV